MIPLYVNGGFSIRVYENAKLKMLTGFRVGADKDIENTLLRPCLDSALNQVLTVGRVEGFGEGLRISQEITTSLVGAAKRSTERNYNQRVLQTEPSSILRLRLDNKYEAKMELITSLEDWIARPQTFAVQRVIDRSRYDQIELTQFDLPVIDTSGFLLVKPVVGIALESGFTIMSKKVTLSAGLTKLIDKANFSLNGKSLSKGIDFSFQIGFSFDDFLSTPLGSCQGGFGYSKSCGKHIFFELVKDVASSQKENTLLENSVIDLSIQKEVFGDQVLCSSPTTGTQLSQFPESSPSFLKFNEMVCTEPSVFVSVPEPKMEADLLVSQRPVSFIQNLNFFLPLAGIVVAGCLFRIKTLFSRSKF
jgi:hypothetical protein